MIAKIAACISIELLLISAAWAGDSFDVRFTGSLPVVATSNALETPSSPKWDEYFDPNFDLKVSHAAWGNASIFADVNTESADYVTFDKAGANLLAMSFGVSQPVGAWKAVAKYRELFVFDQSLRTEEADFHDIVFSLGRDFKLTGMTDVSFAGTAIRRFARGGSDRTILQIVTGPTWTLGKWALSLTGTASYTIYDAGSPAPRDWFLKSDLGATYNINDRYDVSFTLSAIDKLSNITAREFTEWTLSPSLDFNFKF